MKIVQISTVCSYGSIARIMADLYHTTVSSHDNAVIAYGRGSSLPSANTHKISSPTDTVFHVLRNFFWGESGFGSAKCTARFLDWLNTERPDLIHLHNIHGFYINVELLFAYIKSHNIPVIWTLHDCWAFTGHCAYYDRINCHKWETHCENCNIHKSTYPYALFKDNSFASYDRKRNAFLNVPSLTLVAPSKWLAGQIAKSFLNSYPIQVIPNGIDTKLFSPVPSDNTIIALPKANSAKKTLLGVASKWEPRKGLAYFEKLAETLDNSYRIILVGLSSHQKKELSRKYPDKIVPLMRTQSIQELAYLYRIADVFVNPTLEDNFPTTNLESLACGTPVITFDTGGSAECLTPACGITVPKGDFEQLLSAVKTISLTPISNDICRKQALNYDKKIQYTKYMELYHSMLPAHQTD